MPNYEVWEKTQWILKIVWLLTLYDALVGLFIVTTNKVSLLYHSMTNTHIVVLIELIEYSITKILVDFAFFRIFHKLQVHFYKKYKDPDLAHTYNEFRKYKKCILWNLRVIICLCGIAYKSIILLNTINIGIACKNLGISR